MTMNIYLCKEGTEYFWLESEEQQEATEGAALYGAIVIRKASDEEADNLMKHAPALINNANEGHILMSEEQT